jgi:hypothetical protein
MIWDLIIGQKCALKLDGKMITTCNEVMYRNRDCFTVLRVVFKPDIFLNRYIIE